MIELWFLLIFHFEGRVIKVYPNTFSDEVGGGGGSGVSPINIMNNKDTKDHPKGVWTLPPNLRLKDVDRKKYIDIGESDRMTLLFKKL